MYICAAPAEKNKPPIMHKQSLQTGEKWIKKDHTNMVSLCTESHISTVRSIMIY